MAPEQKRLPSEPYCFWCECKEKENQKLRDKIKKQCQRCYKKFLVVAGAKKNN